MRINNQAKGSKIPLIPHKSEKKISESLCDKVNISFDKAEPEYVNLSDKSPVSEGWAGVNKPKMGVNERGEKVVFKKNTQGPLERILTGEEMREYEINEIVASHIIRDEFSLPAVEYREAYTVKDGKRDEGIVSDFVSGLKVAGTLAGGDEEGLVKKISNPDEAVAQCIIMGWMGDWDKIKNNSNIFIDPNNKALAADFGFSFSPGITFFGIPKANELIMNNLAKPENVKPVVEKIKSFSNKDIRGMVHRAGTKYVKDWSEEQEKRITGVLIKNRDDLKKDNPFDNYFEGFHPFLHRPFNSITKPLMFFGLFKDKPKLWNHPEVVLDGVSTLAEEHSFIAAAKVTGGLAGAIMTLEDTISGEISAVPEEKTTPENSLSIKNGLDHYREHIKASIAEAGLFGATGAGIGALTFGSFGAVIGGLVGAVLPALFYMKS